MGYSAIKIWCPTHFHKVNGEARLQDMPPRKGRIRVGIGGWTFAPWRGSFYPAGLAHARELAYASRNLTSIEINATFYGSQKPESFARWHDETPDDFVFSVKGPRFATNRRALSEAGPAIERFFTSGVMELREKLGPINWQLPPTKAFDPADFEAFLELLPARVDGRPIRHAVEARHASFCTPAFTSLLKRHRVAAVVAGDSKYPQIADITAPFVYARIMGTRDTLDAGYSAAELDLWADRARTWAEGRLPPDLRTVGPAKNDRKAHDVYLYVIDGHKPRNPAAALALIERIGKVGS